MIQIRNWGKHQHFKDRCPPWIKLYREILDDPDWHELSGDDSKLLLSLWLIASEDETHQGILPDVRRICFRLRIKEAQLNQALTRLKDWLIFDDIKPISNGYQVDAPETETEGETKESLSSTSLPPCPQKRILELFNKHCPTLAQPRHELWIEGKNGQALAARWKWVLTATKSKTGERYATDHASGVDFFDRYFAYVAKSEFLTGEKWSADLGWLVNKSNFEKVLNGNYENKS